MLKGSDGLMSLALSSDGEGRSGLGETKARPKATGPITAKYALVLYLNEKSSIGREAAANHDCTQYASLVIVLIYLQITKCAGASELISK